jgi:uncharacterized RDD family membrane protein YckC
MHCAKCGMEAAPSARVCQHCGTELSGRYAVSPAAPDQMTPSNSVELPYAGFWRRVAAFAIDGILLGTVGQALGVALGARLATLGQGGRWIGFVIAAIYVIPAHHFWGQTVGKRVMGLRVQRLDGAPLCLSTASIRYLALAVPWFLNGVFFTASQWPWALLVAVGVVLGSVLLIGILGNLYLLTLNRPSRRLIHDWLAGTIVVRAAPERLALPSEGIKAAPVHVVIVGFIPAAILAILGWIALRAHVTPRQIAQLQTAQEAVNRLPGLLQGSLVDQENFGTGGRTHLISVQLWVTDQDETKRRILKRQAVGTILRLYPDSRAVDGIAVVSRWGFDIGIATLWRSDNESHSVVEWQGMLGGPSGP